MKTITLGSTRYPGLVALVDDEDYDTVVVRPWCPFKTTSHSYYAKSTVDGNDVYMHWLIRPDWPRGQIDHADRNGLNNTKVNLRKCNGSQQNANRLLPKNGTASMYRGVTREKNKWRARISVGHKDKRLGMFTSEVEAAKAYDAAALVAWGEYAVLNFPTESAL